MNQWYVIQTKPLRENDVSLQLGRANFEVFNPKIQRFVAGAVGQHSRLQPLFPSYLFIKANFERGTTYHLIKYTRGVNRILGIGERPASVPLEVVDMIRSKTERDGFFAEKTKYQKGDQVRVKRGLLKDLIGILERPVSAEGRVHVLLQIMQRQMFAKMNCSDVERLN